MKMTVRQAIDQMKSWEFGDPMSDSSVAIESALEYLELYDNLLYKLEDYLDANKTKHNVDFNHGFRKAIDLIMGNCQMPDTRKCNKDTAELQLELIDGGATDLRGFIRLLTDSRYSVEFSRGTFGSVECKSSDHAPRTCVRPDPDNHQEG